MKALSQTCKKAWKIAKREYSVHSKKMHEWKAVHINSPKMSTAGGKNSTNVLTALTAFCISALSSFLFVQFHPLPSLPRTLPLLKGLKELILGRKNNQVSSKWSLRSRGEGLCGRQCNGFLHTKEALVIVRYNGKHSQAWSLRLATSWRTKLCKQLFWKRARIRWRETLAHCV